MKYLFTLTLLFIFSLITVAQNATITQTIRGHVTNAKNNLPLEGATVYLLANQVEKATYTDKDGKFRFDSIPVGRCQLQVSYVGFQSKIISEILLESGKEVVKSIQLEGGIEEMKEVTVVAGRTTPNTLSLQTITPEQTQRFAATFYDPARLATSYAGVVSQNDGANNLIVRGNSPASTTWWLEGAEIVNPNHTANAGTFSDNIMASGGGVNIMSAQLLGDSYFLKGNYPTQYGNGLGGILDMRLRQGNNETHEFTAQIGLIGIDVAAEGPLSKQRSGSYLINYRYSTLGLLSQLGVPLGDEEINFQDVSFNVALPTQKLGQFTVFGMAGQSKNTFEAQRDNTLWQFQKDRQDIYFTSWMTAVGGTHRLSISDKVMWKSTVAFSAMEANRDAFQLDSNYIKSSLSKDARQDGKTSISSLIQVQVNENTSLKAGFVGTNYRQDVRAANYLQEDTLSIIMDGFRQNWLARPYVNLDFRPNSRLQMNIGMGYAHFFANQTHSFEPLFSVNYQLKENHSLNFAYRLQSQLQSPTIYFGTQATANTFLGDLSTNRINHNLEMSKAHHLGLSHKTTILNQYTVNTEAYYQQLFDIPVVNNSNFSAINLLDEIIQDTLVSLGTGRNYGMEVTVEKYMNDGYYFLLTGTIFESKYTAADGIERNTRFNGNYGTVLSGGKEFYWTSKRKHEKTLGINLKVTYLGGLRATPVDEVASAAAQATVFDTQQAFVNRYPNYFKTDLRLYLKKNHNKYTTTLAIDIQNITNHQNAAFDYFDTEMQEIVRKYQLGIIPILIYRVEF